MTVDSALVRAMDHVATDPEGIWLLARAFALIRERPHMLSDDGGWQALHALLHRELADLSTEESPQQELVSSAFVAARHLYKADHAAPF
jgi:hypothetical protein